MDGRGGMLWSANSRSRITHHASRTGMDRKSIIVIAVCFLLMLLLQPLSNKLFPPRPLPPEATNAVTATQAVTVAGTNLAPATAATPPSLTAAVAPRPAFLTNAPEQTVVVTNENARYTFTSLGGGLKLVELTRYPETVSKRGQKQTPTNGVATLNTRALVPVLAQLGGESVEGDGIFTLTRTATGVRAEKVLTNGLRVVKEFQLSTNYLVNATIRLENDSAQPLDLPAQEWAIGTATPMGPDDKGLAVGVMWYDALRTVDINQTWFDNRSFGCIPGVPRPEYRTGTNSVVWAAMHNQYFTLVAMPNEPTAQLVSWPVNLPSASVETSVTGFTNAPPKGLQTALVYPSVSLAPGAAVERQIPFFAGPKEYRTLARIASRYQNNVDLVMGYSGFFGFFAKALLLAMNWVHDVAWLSYGWAVVAITVIIKMIFWPLTAAGTRSMKRMQALQPQMNALKAKYKDDPAKMNKKLMDPQRHRIARRAFPMGRGFGQARHTVRHSRSGLHSGHRHSRRGVALQPAADDLHRHRALAIAPYAGVSGHGSHATEDDALDAADVPADSLQLLLRPRALHDRAKPADHPANQADPHVRRAGARASFGIDAGAKKEEIVGPMRFSTRNAPRPTAIFDIPHSTFRI